MVQFVAWGEGGGRNVLSKAHSLRYTILSIGCRVNGKMSQPARVALSTIIRDYFTSVSGIS